MGHFDRIQCFGEGANLVQFDQDRVAGGLANAPVEAGSVGDVEVITNQLHLVAQARGQLLPTIPVILGKAILDRDDRVFPGSIGIPVDEFVSSQRAALTRQHVLAVFEELGGCRVEGYVNVLAQFVSGLFDSLGNQFQRFGIGAQARGVSALVTDHRVVAVGCQHFAQRMEDLGRPADALAEIRSANRHDHELLHIHAGAFSVLATIQDVHHWDRQRGCRRTTQVLVERQADGVRCGAGNRQRHAQDRIGTDIALVRRPVDFNHPGVQRTLVKGVHPAKFFRKGGVDVFDCLLDTLAAVPALVSVTKFNCFVCSGRRTRGHRGPAHRPVVQADIHLDGRVAPRVENFPPADNVNPRTHLVTQHPDVTSTD